MEKQRFLLITLFVIISALGLCACGTTTPEESELPWSEPKSWEGGAPGFGDRSFGSGF